MILLKGLCALILLFIMPYFIGCFFSKLIKKEHNLCMNFIIGYLIEFTICEIISVPMIFLDCKFTTLYYVYMSVLSILTIISIIFTYKKVKTTIIDAINYTKEVPKFFFIVTIILIGVQVFGLVGYMHEDADDSVYVATALTSIETNSLYKYSPSSGAETGEHQIMRYRLAPFPLFYAIVAETISMHPTIVAHTILPIILIPLAYIVYGLIANELLQGNKKKVWQFLFVLSVLHIWCNYTNRSNMVFLLFRVWQGKSVMINFIVPAVILFFIKCDKYNLDLSSLILLFITIFAGNFTTTMGVAIPPMALMLLAVSYEISKFNFRELKKNNYSLHIKNLLKYLACCSSSIILGIIYFI